MCTLLSLWHFFHKGEKQNTAQFTAYCTGCVDHHTKELLKEDDREMDDATRLERKARIFKEVCKMPQNMIYLLTNTLVSAYRLTGSTCSEREAQIMLSTLFRGKVRQPQRVVVMNEEEILMEALAEQLEDNRLDDGAIEVDGDKYKP
jgi:hypothetical protein